MLKYKSVALVCVLALVAGIGTAMAYYVHGRSSYKERKAEEKSAVIQLVSAFVSTYSQHRISDQKYKMPVPATFRANALDAFNEAQKSNDATIVEMVGIPGFEIKNRAKDEHAKNLIEKMANSEANEFWSDYFQNGTTEHLRTVKLVTASKESCVSCHNSLQFGLKVWKIGDVMGAYVLDTPTFNYVNTLRNNTVQIGFISFLLALLTGGLAVKIQHSITKSREDLKLQMEKEKLLTESRYASEAANRAKSEFLANMSHEIRTPMNGVMGMAELLSKTSLDAKQKMFANVIVKSGDALLTIINDILDFSKIDAGQMELDPAPFNLKEAIEDVATLVSSGAAEKDLELIVRVEPTLPEYLVGDAGRVRQIITNLMGNAVKFTEKGHVYINVNGSISGQDGNQTARLYVTVEDTGIGIPDDKVGKIFDMFSQVDESATRRHQGTGLGLSITASLVEMMNGKIGVESTLGEGSTFWFEIELPVDAGKKQTKRVPTDVSGARILLVDDNEVNRSILVELMDAWKFDSAAATNGKEALAVMRAAGARGISIDCVVMDYQMPDMSGADAFRSMQAEKELADIPVVMLTSVEELEDGKPFSTLGVHGHLTKPARSSLLLETIVNVLQGRKSGDDSGFDEMRSGIEFARWIGDAPASSSVVAVSKVIADVDTVKDALCETGDGLDVLVCEDNEVNQIVFTQILEAANLNFAIAKNGSEGLNLYKEQSPKIILMDVSMPGMNGLEATAEIRKLEQENGTHTPIIGVTAHAIKGDKEKCLEAGMDDYLSKPVSPDKLTTKLFRWMGKEEMLEMSG